jgi:hypothetical protein
MKIFAIIVALALIVLAIVFGPNIHQHFGQRYADADRNIHQRSKSFVFGAIEHIQRLKIEYDKSINLKHKESIRQMVLLEASNVGIENLPPHLQQWILTLQNKQPLTLERR